MNLFDGNLKASILDAEIADKVSHMEKMPVLDIVNFGDNPSSKKYIDIKKTVGEKLGIQVNVYDFGFDIGAKDHFNFLLESEPRSGVIVQLPLLSYIGNTLLDKIPAERDVDLLSSSNLSKFYSKDFSRLSPVIRSLSLFLETSKVAPKTHDVLVLGDGVLVGKPVAFYLSSLGYSVRVVNNYEKGTKIPEKLVISCTGIPNLIQGPCLSPKACVVDFGSAVVNDKVVGDVDMSSDLSHLDLVSLSPGGMGPLVVRYLFLNLLEFTKGL